MRKTSYDSGESFRGMPRKALLTHGTRLYRLLRLATGTYFTDVWWMPAQVYKELHDDAQRSQHGGGRFFETTWRNISRFLRAITSFALSKSNSRITSMRG